MVFIISSLVDVLLETEEFFTRIKDKGYLQPIGYYTTLSFLILCLNWLLLNQHIVLPAGMTPFLDIVGVAGYAFMYWASFVTFLLGIVFVFVFSFFVKIISSLSGAHTKIKDVLKVTMYGATPSIIASWIPFLGVLFLAWSVYIESMGLGVYNKKSMRANMGILILAGLITAALVIVTLLSIVSFYSSMYEVPFRGLEVFLQFNSV